MANVLSSALFRLKPVRMSPGHWDMSRVVMAMRLEPREEAMVQPSLERPAENKEKMKKKEEGRHFGGSSERAQFHLSPDPFSHFSKRLIICYNRPSVRPSVPSYVPVCLLKRKLLPPTCL